jgi:hypothetical protein
MSDLEFFYVVWVAFYLWECSHWLLTPVVPFVSWFGGTFRRARPFFVASSRGAGLVLASPIPLWGTLLAASEWPLAVSPLGVVTLDGTTVSFADQPRFQARGHRLMANQARLAEAHSSAQARWLADTLKRISATPEAGREAPILGALRESLDPAAVSARLDEFKTVARCASLAAAALFLYGFVMAPALVWRWGLLPLWPWTLGGLVILCGVNAFAFFRAHRKLHPQLDDERVAHVLMVLLFPPAGMRARDLLSRPLLQRFHPLAVAGALGDPGELKVMVGRAWRELRYPRTEPPSRTAEAGEVRAWYHRALLAEVERFAGRNGLQPDQFASAPERSDAECRSYCPRCQAQFTRAEGTCSDCGVGLVGLR